MSDERSTEYMIAAHLRGPTVICMFLMRLSFALLAPEFAALFARIITAFGPSHETTIAISAFTRFARGCSALGGPSTVSSRRGAFTKKAPPREPPLEER
jgi:hypothetical protein